MTELQAKKSRADQIADTADNKTWCRNKDAQGGNRPVD